MALQTLKKAGTPRTPLLIWLCYISGLAASLALRWEYTPWLALWGCLAAVMAFLIRKDAFRFAFLFFLVFLGLFTGSLRIMSLGDSFLVDLAGKRGAIAVTVTNPPNEKAGKIRFVGEATRVQWQGKEAAIGEDVMVEAGCGGPCEERLASISEGTLIEVQTEISKPLSRTGADFDYGEFLRQRGINVELKTSAGQLKVLPQKRGGFSGMIDSIREFSRQSLRAGGWGAAGSLLQAMVLGDDQAVPDQVISDFRDSGLLHMLAVSGENVILLGAIVQLLLRLMMVPRLAAAVISIAVIGGYVPLTGSGPSILRAGVVGILAMAALLFSRQKDKYHFLAIAAAVILSLNPYSLFDPGFQLSFMAVLAIFFISPLLFSMLSFLPKALGEAASISLATGLATAPITLASFHQVSMVTVPANIAAAFATGPIMMLGVLAVITRPLLPLISWAMVLAASAFTAYLICAAHFFASLPGAVYNGDSPGVIQTLAYYSALFGTVFLLQKPYLAALWRHLAGSYLNTRQRFAIRNLPRDHRYLRWLVPWRFPLALLLLCLALLAGLTFGFAQNRQSTASPPDSFRVSFLDVGQGDAELIQVPPEPGRQWFAILIDGGPGEAVVERLKESGVQKLDAVFVTHPDADHLAGLLPVLRNFPVGAVYDAEQPSASLLYHDFREIANREHIGYHLARKGQVISFGGLQLDVLNPSDSLRPDSVNANSIVLLASFEGLDILFPGDAESDVLASLNLPEVAIFEVPHHGSSDSGAGKVLNAIRPRMVVISVGEGNPYGHPADSTLSDLKKSGARIFRTDRQGTVRFSYSGGDVVINTQK